MHRLPGRAEAWSPLASAHVNHKVIGTGKLERGDSCIGHSTVRITVDIRDGAMS